MSYTHRVSICMNIEICGYFDCPIFPNTVNPSEKQKHVILGWLRRLIVENYKLFCLIVAISSTFAEEIRGVHQ